MLIDPNAPASEMPIRAELASRILQILAPGAPWSSPSFTEHTLAMSIRVADKFIQMLNHDPAPDTEEETFKFMADNYVRG